MDLGCHLKVGINLATDDASFPRTVDRFYYYKVQLCNLASLNLPTKKNYPPTTKMSNRDLYNLRTKYTRFRILVIGRANAGKTTLLQRVCNTTEDPCIYDENNKNLVSVCTEDDFYI